jgi:hypothetical protein
VSDKPEPKKPAKPFSDEELGRMAREALEDAAAERERIIKVIQKQRNTPPPMDTPENLHASLTRAFAALHRIAALPCQTNPEEAEDDEARRGYRQSCHDASCAPCLALHTLIVEGQLPF